VPREPGQAAEPGCEVASAEREVELRELRDELRREQWLELRELVGDVERQVSQRRPLRGAGPQAERVRPRTAHEPHVLELRQRGHVLEHESAQATERRHARDHVREEAHDLTSRSTTVAISGRASASPGAVARTAQLARNPRSNVTFAFSIARSPRSHSVV
jgi:hypothetical protein